jgi:hypothetical protein
MDMVQAVEEMKLSEHHILVTLSDQSGYTYKSFVGEQTLHTWMSALSDQHRDVCGVDLSSWSHAGASRELRQWTSHEFVSPLAVGIQWHSEDDLPDPDARDKIDLLIKYIDQSIQSMPGHQHQLPLVYTQRDRSVVSHQFRNCYLLFATNILFDNHHCLSDYIQTVLIPTLVDEPQLHEHHDQCIVYSRPTRLEMPGCTQPGLHGITMAPISDLRQFRNCLHRSEVMEYHHPIISQQELNSVCK